MPCFRRKIPALLRCLALLAFVSELGCMQARAQFYDFTRAIPQKDPNGTPMAGTNTAFADGTVFQPAADAARSSSWSWRPFGNISILSSLGPGTSTLPTNTKELVTVVSGLKPGKPYAVKVLFWGTGSWGVRAGLTNAGGTRTNPWFDSTSTNVMAAELLPWNVMPALFEENGRTLYAGHLGTTTADGNGKLKVYVHDLPTGDSNLRTWYQGVAVSDASPLTAQMIDVITNGTPFHRGVRGLALADITIDRGEYWVGIPKSLEVARGGAIRGVATGIAAELYDWRVRNGQARPPTLHFLRYSRDFDAELFLGVNLRGLVEPNPGGGFRYYDTNASTMATVAADWVRYVNHIVPTYRQGDALTNSRDAAIMGSLTWSSGVAGDTFDTLLAPGEAAVPPVQYWEIGNEPTVGVTAYSVSNSFTLNATNFYARYKTVVQAIKAENPAVKVGPTLIGGTRDDDRLAAIAADGTVPIDFVTYHPYEKMGLLTDPAEVTQFLGNVSTHQKRYLDDLKAVLTTNGRNAEAIEYAATEVNVSDWPSNDSDKEARMAHALGTVETVFTHARLGLVSSMYWIWPTHRWDGTEYPVFRAYQGLRDHMGDTLLSVYSYPDMRLYVTRDSRSGEVAVWVLNFSNSQDLTIPLQWQNLFKVQNATLLRLQDLTTKTTLESANLASDMLGGPAYRVGWTSTNLTGTNLQNYSLSAPAATISLLIIQPGLGALTPGFVDHAGGKRFAVTFRRLPNASRLHYKLLGSDDLVTWETVGEADAGLPDELSIQDNRPATASPHRYYRVEAAIP